MIAGIVLAVTIIGVLVIFFHYRCYDIGYTNGSTDGYSMGRVDEKERQERNLFDYQYIGDGVSPLMEKLPLSQEPLEVVEELPQPEEEKVEQEIIPEAPLPIHVEAPKRTAGRPKGSKKKQKAEKKNLKNKKHHHKNR